MDFHNKCLTTPIKREFKIELYEQPNYSLLTFKQIFLKVQ
jgi:hypothetical protein